MGATGSLGNISYLVSEYARFSTECLWTNHFYRASEMLSCQSGGNSVCSGVLFSTSYVVLYVINRGRKSLLMYEHVQIHSPINLKN